jgi:hypothetical protein
MRITHKERQPSRYSRKQRIKSRNFNTTMMKNLMWKKQISLKNFRKDQGSTKERCLSNVLTMSRLAILQPSVPIPRMTLNMKKTKSNSTRKRKNPTTRKSFTMGKRNFTQKNKTTVHQSIVTVMMMKSFF